MKRASMKVLVFLHHTGLFDIFYKYMYSYNVHSRHRYYTNSTYLRRANKNCPQI